jgi:hypothetical protein
MRSRRQEDRGRNGRPSGELFDHVSRPVGANLPGSDGEQPVRTVDVSAATTARASSASMSHQSGAAFV